MFSDDDTTSVDARLLSLIDRGYRFIHPRDKNGSVVAVVGIRAHHSVVDVLRMDAEDDVTAFRVPGDEQDILNPRRMLWRCRGTAHTVLDELVELADDYAGGGRRVTGCWVPGEGGRAKWLAAAG
ncbi:hypothetical protein HFP15_24040 [Amycolatopsis sp. K13G38]|uniref:Uncharacterized protein n=1 Tax=Amycolatopsis acididurans TaxID=2724524 RepID=A0ABX1J822_9PSEU|nr:hypothetical protein [Amycolatopsis acididurans]NKQ55953.1 hypothetical protein [Amycolatopsis acididurans]